MVSPNAESSSIELWVPRWDDREDNKTTTTNDRIENRSEEITKYGYLAKRKRPSPCLPTHQQDSDEVQKKQTKDYRFRRPDYGSQFGTWLRDAWHTHFFTVNGPYATYYDKPPFLNTSTSRKDMNTKDGNKNNNTGMPIACIDLRTMQLDLQHGDTIVLRSLISGDGLVLRADGLEEAQDWVSAFGSGGAQLHISQIQQRPTTADNATAGHRLQSKQEVIDDADTNLARARRKSLDPTIARRRSSRKTSESLSQPIVSQPSTSQQATSQPATSQPTISQPITSQPKTSQPATSQPVSSQRATSQPATSQPLVSQPIVSQPASEHQVPSVAEQVVSKPQRPVAMGRRMSLPRALADVRRANTQLHALEAAHGGERLRLRSGSISIATTHQGATQKDTSERPNSMRGLRTSSLRSRNAMSLPLSGLRGRSPVSPVNNDFSNVADASNVASSAPVCKAVPRSEAVRVARQFGALVVLSFNILAQSFVDNPRLSNIYGHCDGQWLQWKYRVSLIIDHIASVLPDVLCLQEVDYNAYHNELVPELDKMGYVGLLQTKEKKNGVYIAGNATFWKVGQVELVWSEHKYRALVCGFQMVSTSAIPRPDSSNESGNAKRNSAAHRLKNGLKSRLSSFASSSSSSSLASNDKELGIGDVHKNTLVQPQFALANVHLEGSPWKHKDRVSQLRSAEKSFVTRKSNCRIICGDFNAGADNVLCHILEMAGYVSAYPTAHKDATCLLMPHDPMAFNQAAACVDHIYFAGEPLNLHAVTSVFEQGWERDTMVRSGLPQKLWPSDHLSIGALLSLDASSAINSPQPRAALFHDLTGVVKRAAKMRSRGWGGANESNGKVNLKQALHESMLSESERLEWLELLRTDVNAEGALVYKCTVHVAEDTDVDASTDAASVIGDDDGAVEDEEEKKNKKRKEKKKKKKKGKNNKKKKTPEQIQALREWSARKKVFIKGLSLDKREFVEWYMKTKRSIEKEEKDAMKM